MYFIYVLYDENDVKYIGITTNIKKRKAEHKRKKPPHYFCIVDEATTPQEASLKEIQLITKNDTYFSGWNNSPGGEYLYSSGHNRLGIGGRKKGCIPWNKGLNKKDIRVLNNVTNASKTRQRNGFYETCSKYLPKLVGEINPMKDKNKIAKMIESRNGKAAADKFRRRHCLI